MSVRCLNPLRLKTQNPLRMIYNDELKSSGMRFDNRGDQGVTLEKELCRPRSSNGYKTHNLG